MTLANVSPALIVALIAGAAAIAAALILRSGSSRARELRESAERLVRRGLQRPGWAAPLLRLSWSTSRSSLGQLPILALTGALALGLIVYSYALARSGQEGAEPWFWIGLVGIVAPPAMRLALGQPHPVERVLLVVLLTSLVYLAKVFHDPFGFTFADELVHVANADLIVQSGALPSGNSIIPVSAQFPGLAGATATLALLTGLSTFGAGVVLVGAARVVLALGLYVLFRRISGSDRIASLGVVFYACSLNFVFWSAQFAYQSLALPLAVLALAAALSRVRTASPNRNAAWSIVALLAMASVVVTHHLTSYVSTGLLLLIAGAGALASRLGRPTNWVPPVGIAIVSAVAVVSWLTFQASETVQYLGPVFGDALRHGLATLGDSSEARKLFESESGYVVPLWERLVGSLAVLLTAAGVAFGAIRGRRLLGSKLLFHLLVGASLVYLASFVLRFVPATWEIANRMTDFLFIGVALVLACAAAAAIRARPHARATAVAFPLVVGILLVGATLASWPPSVRLPLPNRVAVGERVTVPQGFSAARWSREVLGEGRTFVADRSNGRLLLAQGGQTVYVARTPNARLLLEEPAIDELHIAVIRETGLEFVALDRRRASDDNMAGYFFDAPDATGAIDRRLRSLEILAKYENEPGVSRLLDTGNITIYDVSGLADATRAR